MQSKTIMIVGLGLIGGSIAKALAAFTPHRVLGMDLDPEVLDQARSSGRDMWKTLLKQTFCGCACIHRRR